MPVNLAVLVVLSLQSQQAAAKMENPVHTSKSVRIYLDFTSETDPAHILTMADLELSIALATPLVVFNNERQVVSGLAERWKTLPPNQISFTLRKDLRWSDGSTVKAIEYKAALERAKREYGSDLKALFDSIVKIEAPDERTVVFTTSEDSTKSGILLKLTEPMYGLVALKDGKLDLSKSSGPFVVKEKSGTQLMLAANKHWYSFVKEMPSFVEIKRPKDDANLITSFPNDEWPNLTTGSSLMTKEAMEHIQSAGYKTWQRSLDKVYAIFPSKRFLHAGGENFIKDLASKVNRAALMKGVSGYSEAEQFFPRGYELYSAKQPEVQSAKPWQKKGPITMLMVESPILATMRKELAKSFGEMGLKIELIQFAEFDERMKRGDYDILATSLAVADPNFDGAMSFFIEREPAFIQSSKGANDFASQLRAARSLATSEERAGRMRDIVIRAQEAGYVLPLLHYSSIAIAKPGVDLSEIPNSDETVLFSKVRMR